MTEVPVVTTVQETEIVVRDIDSLEAKLARFGLAGASGLHVVLDFDRTLTYSPRDGQKVVSSWQILEEHLPPEGSRRQRELFDTYYPKEKDGSMQEDESRAWWTGALGLFTEYKLDLIEVERQFVDNANIRPGVQELFSFCRQHDIPTVILSAGIKNVIELWARHYSLEPSVVLSTELILDEHGRVAGWEDNTLVHLLNKAEIGHPELSKIRHERPNAVLVGDGERDADMAVGEENVLRVRIQDFEPGETTDVVAYQRKTFAEFDGLVQGESMLPIVNILQKIVSARG